MEQILSINEKRNLKTKKSQCHYTPNTITIYTKNWNVREKNNKKFCIQTYIRIINIMHLAPSILIFESIASHK